MPAPADHPAQKIYILRASAAPRALVFVKHRQKRWSLHLWHLDTRHVEPGAAFYGTLYPRRCDISPDGRYLIYFAIKPTKAPDWPWQFSGLSRAPWLTCLLAWSEPGTWTRGMHFTSRASGRPTLPGPLHHIVDSLDRCRWNIERTEAIGLAAERRIGFVEGSDSPPRSPDDVWDQHRKAILHKRSPGRGLEDLRVTWSAVEGDEGGIEGTRNVYSLRLKSGTEVPLPEVAWVDWLDGDHLYGATWDGRLVVWERRGEGLEETWSHTFERMRTRAPAPEWARGW